MIGGEVVPAPKKNVWLSPIRMHQLFLISLFMQTKKIAFSALDNYDVA